MARRLQTYEGSGFAVTFDPNLCLHSGNCVRGLPAVFDVRRSRWVDVDGASAEAIEAQVARCPSGALQVPESRRLGCARWTVEKAIEHAWQKFGLPIGLYASQSGLSVYQKMGFEHLNKVEVYRRL